MDDNEYFRKYKFKSYMNRPDITAKVKEKIVEECYGTKTHEEIAREFKVSVAFISFLKRKWDKENLYGQKRNRKSENHSVS